MLSKPSIFHDSRSEVIKGQTIEVSCQSINGTSPIFYQLSKASKTLASQSVGSNEPAIFKDNPTKDVEYRCIADNCHSHTKLVSELLQVKVIGKSCGKKNPCGTGALVHIFKGLEWTRIVGGTCAKSMDVTCGKADQGPSKWSRKISGGYQCGQCHPFPESFKWTAEIISVKCPKLRKHRSCALGLP